MYWLKQGKLPFLLVIIILTGILSGCAILHKTTHHYQWTDYNYQIITIDSTITPDSTIAAYLGPYRKHVNQLMDKVIGKSSGIFTKNKPEGTLGNLVADAVRVEASLLMKKNIDISVITNSSIKYRLPRGNITMRMVYDIMPYNNKLVILKLNGRQIKDMADEIARSGGEPVSGIRMNIKDGKATDILIGRHILNDQQIYTVATNDYMANGGGDLAALWNPISRYDKQLSIRKAIEEYINDRSVVTPITDGRVR
ncbi:MAG TPA: 5'-nucleotidase [Balneolales bacterium]|nr:5'-nucleotidase [Balneolales bacterium]